jgi:hypothetical protein
MIFCERTFLVLMVGREDRSLSGGEIESAIVNALCVSRAPAIERDLHCMSRETGKRGVLCKQG